MKRIITLDDFIETYTKLHQRGASFIRSKFKINNLERAKTAFNHEHIEASNWWIIPSVLERWNALVTGSKKLDFIDFTMNNFLSKKQNLKMLSLGSGNCFTEMKFASFNNFEEIVCSDISDISLKKAEELAIKNQLNNLKFIVQDTNTFSFPDTYYDVIYFKASLHHFKNIDTMVGELIKNALKPNGFLIIDEYVGPNRIQYPKHQIKAINDALLLIPKQYRKRFKLNIFKNKVYGSGIIRMKIADPSECIESEKILPTIHQHYKTVYEANYGGNILMTCLKDISHHFIDLDEEKKGILNNLFLFEDQYLKVNKSDFVFGIYQPNLDLL